MTVGRFAPSPTGSLHVGNLRTALVAWLFARSRGGSFVIRVEDLDPAARRHDVVEEQLADLAAIGVTSDVDVIRQSDPDVRARHESALDHLDAAGLLYPCFCSRREIAEAAVAAHPGATAPERAYPGTCRHLDASERAAHTRRLSREGRGPALRVRADDVRVAVHDRLCGDVVADIDDFVVRRGDGVPAYNLAVVVDDAHQGIDQVVRGDDLLLGTPRQVWLAERLGLSVPEYVHVPLVVGDDGERLAKRHGSVTRSDLAAVGVEDAGLLALLGSSLDLCDPSEPVTIDVLVARFDPDAVPRDVWVFRPPES